MNTKEYIDYAQVAQGAEEIRQAAQRMNEIFNDLSGSMSNMTNESVLKGKIRKALEENFAPFKNDFGKYVNLVESFAAIYKKASEELAENEEFNANQINNI